MAVWPATAGLAHGVLRSGFAEVDFPAVLEQIALTGYKGWITVELYPYIDDPDAAGRAAKDFLEPLVEKAGRHFEKEE